MYSPGTWNCGIPCVVLHYICFYLLLQAHISLTKSIVNNPRGRTLIYVKIAVATTAFYYLNVTQSRRGSRSEKKKM